MEPKILHLENEPLTLLIPWGSLILCSCILIMVLLSNILERWFLARLYPTLWADLSSGQNERRRRSFTYFHLGITIMIMIVVLGVYPVFNFLVGRARPSHMLLWHVTYGDHLFVLSQTYSAYYLFEMCFRTRFASAIGIAHHIGLLLVVQTALSLFGDLERHPEAILEFYMCMIWGAFDVVVELPLYTFMIIWRVKEKNHKLLSQLAYSCFVWVVIGATVETAITIWLLSISWHRWGLTFRFMLPAVFTLWISTQLYGASRILSMARSQARLAVGRHEEDGILGREITSNNNHKKSEHEGRHRDG